MSGKRNVQVWAFAFSLWLFLAMLSLFMTPVPGWAAHLQEQLDEWNLLRSHLDAFVVTAYLTDQLKPGDTIWPKK
jgi:hypothetical protein